MGLTVACARCHDHKFDPIATKDYYGPGGDLLLSHILSDMGPRAAARVPVRAPLMGEPELGAAQERRSALSRSSTRNRIGSWMRSTRRLASAMLPQADKYLAGGVGVTSITRAARRARHWP
jgi:hypothetical protein